MLVLKRKNGGEPVLIEHVDGQHLLVWLVRTRKRPESAKVEFAGHGFSFTNIDGEKFVKAAWIERGNHLIATHLASGLEVCVCLTPDGVSESEARLGFEADKDVFRITRGELLKK